MARFAKNTKGLDLIPEIANKLSENNINYEWSFVGKNIDQIKTLVNKSLDAKPKKDKNFQVRSFEELIALTEKNKESELKYDLERDTYNTGTLCTVCSLTHLFISYVYYGAVSTSSPFLTDYPLRVAIATLSESIRKKTFILKIFTNPSHTWCFQAFLNIPPKGSQAVARSCGRSGDPGGAFRLSEGARTGAFWCQTSSEKSVLYRTYFGPLLTTFQRPNWASD